MFNMSKVRQTTAPSERAESVSRVAIRSKNKCYSWESNPELGNITRWQCLILPLNHCSYGLMPSCHVVIQ